MHPAPPMPRCARRALRRAPRRTRHLCPRSRCARPAPRRRARSTRRAWVGTTAGSAGRGFHGNFSCFLRTAHVLRLEGLGALRPRSTLVCPHAEAGTIDDWMSLSYRRCRIAFVTQIALFARCATRNWLATFLDAWWLPQRRREAHPAAGGVVAQEERHRLSCDTAFPAELLFESGVGLLRRCLRASYSSPASPPAGRSLLRRRACGASARARPHQAR